MGRAVVLVVGMSLTAGAACGGGGAECGPGTELVGDQCLAFAPDAPPAGPDAAAPGATFEIRALSLMIADGHTEFPVLVLGSNADGTPYHGDVVLNIDRAGAGEYTDALVTLDDLGATSSFVPCNSTTAGCVGPLTLTMALPADPTTPVAHVDSMLGPPADVGSVTECLAGGNILHLDGNDYIYNGILTVDAATWGAEGDAQKIQIGIVPDDPAMQGTMWNTEFETRKLGVDMVPSVYDMAQRLPLEADGHPGMDISGDGRSCNLLNGRFQVHEYDVMFGFVDRVTISFEQHCENSTTTVLTGCVHYERTP